MAIEGVDGSGKTTQAKMLVGRLEKLGYNAVYIRPVYILVSILLRKKDSISVSPRKMRTSQKDTNLLKVVILGFFGYLYAFTSYLYIRFCLSRGKIVVCDRYFYQFFFDLFGDFAERVIRLFPKPDVTFLLDGELDVFYSRMSDSFDVEVSREYYSKVIEFYRKLAKKYGFIKINAHLKKEEISEIIFKHLMERMSNKKIKGGL